MFPFLHLFAESKESRKIGYQREILFVINQDDPSLNDLLDDFNLGYFGKGDTSMGWLLEELGKEGYEVKPWAEHGFMVGRGTVKTGKRRIKILTLK